MGLPGATSCALLASATLLPLAPANADDFLAMPGLWVTTLTESTRSSAGTRPAHTDWHCVDDEIDPWTSFIPAPDHAGDQCTRTMSARTATSLKWHMECKGSASFASDGILQFDSAQHYTGSIVETHSDSGRAVERKLTVEGRRRAACTTPSD